jgi:hypothetical protein
MTANSPMDNHTNNFEAFDRLSNVKKEVLNITIKLSRYTLHFIVNLDELIKYSEFITCILSIHHKILM